MVSLPQQTLTKRIIGCMLHVQVSTQPISVLLFLTGSYMRAVCFIVFGSL